MHHFCAWRSVARQQVHLQDCKSTVCAGVIIVIIIKAILVSVRSGANRPNRLHICQCGCGGGGGHCWCWIFCNSEWPVWFFKFMGLWHRQKISRFDVLCAWRLISYWGSQSCYIVISVASWFELQFIFLFVFLIFWACCSVAVNIDGGDTTLFQGSNTALWDALARDNKNIRY